MTNQILRAARFFDGHDILIGAEAEIKGDRVVAIGPRTARTQNVVDLGDATVAPGLVDVHSHGGGGVEFTGNPRVAAEAHLRAGTTSIVASTVTGSIEALEAQVQALVPFVQDGTLAGIHLEGPWLASKYKGAHPIDRLQDPAMADVERLVAAGDGTVRMVTLAVERQGALDAVRWLASRGIVAALGHSDCTYEQACEAIEAGVTGATHLFNAMPGLHHRHPGPVLALLDDDRVWCELIFDGVHVRPELHARVLREKKRSVLITDAMAAAGMPNGHYMLGELGVTVTDQVARTDVDGSIAGSTLVLSRAVRNAIEAGVDETIVLRAATSNPAAYLSLDGVGVLAAGAMANAVVFDAAWDVQKVLYRGAWLG